ncbi:MAG TPA: hypothetical protein VM689_20660 [Aliidongia sp.]|nr:hypothetical protein [Aliidongia sp.]
MNISQVASTAMLNALLALANSGTLKLYTGPKPTNPDTALGSQTLLATFAFAATAFGSPSLGSGVEGANASFTASTVTAVATGTAVFARITKSDGTTVIADLTIGTSGADINLNSTAITSGGNVTLTSLAWNNPVD